jgi:hypothetical protein
VELVAAAVAACLEADAATLEEPCEALLAQQLLAPRLNRNECLAVGVHYLHCSVYSGQQCLAGVIGDEPLPDLR